MGLEGLTTPDAQPEEAFQAALPNWSIPRRPLCPLQGCKRDVGGRLERCFQATVVKRQSRRPGLGQQLQHRQRCDLNALFQQGPGVLHRGIADDAPLVRFAIMDLAGFLGKPVADILGSGEIGRTVSGERK